MVLSPPLVGEMVGPKLSEMMGAKEVTIKGSVRKIWDVQKQLLLNAHRLLISIQADSKLLESDKILTENLRSISIPLMYNAMTVLSFTTGAS